MTNYNAIASSPTAAASISGSDIIVLGNPDVPAANKATTITLLIAAIKLIDGITASPTELNYLDITAPGTAQASKAVVLDSNKDIAALRNLTVTNLDAGASGTAGSVDIFPTTAASGKLTITVSDQAANHAVILNAANMAATRTITIPDPGAAANVLMTTGTATATDATSAEITRAADMSARVVNCTDATLAVTEALHDGKIIVLDRAAGIAVTLPVPVAGMWFRFIVKTTFSGAASIKSVAGTHIMIGHAIMGNDSDNAVVRWPAVAADTFDTIDMLGTGNSTGGIEGQTIDIKALSSTLWHVEIVGDSAGTEATPFANTVA